MKKLGLVMMAMMIMAVGSVMATPTTGFHLDNNIAVTGDWVYDGGWSQPNPAPVTASFEMDIDSSTATEAQFGEIAMFGAPWHLDYSSSAVVNAPTSFSNVLNAVTINPPDTTPGLDWTEVGYTQATGSDFSGSNMVVNGFGKIQVSSNIITQGEGFQNVGLNIN